MKELLKFLTGVFITIGTIHNVFSHCALSYFAHLTVTEKLSSLRQAPVAIDIFRLNVYLKPRFCSRHRSEAQETLAKRAVGEILARRHIHKYVQDQNLETSVAARFLKPQ